VPILDATANRAGRLRRIVTLAALVLALAAMAQPAAGMCGCAWFEARRFAAST